MFDDSELDLNENRFGRRMQEAQFAWIASNVFDKASKSFFKRYFTLF